MKESVDKLLSGFAEDGEAETLTIDLSPFLVGDGGLRELRWAKPDVPTLYNVGGDAAELQKKFVGMPAEMAIEVALMGTCHLAASGPFTGSETSPTLFYAAIA